MEALINRYCRFLGQGVENRSAVISYTIAMMIVLLVAIFPLFNFYTKHKQDFVEQRDLAVWLQSQQQQLDMAAAYVEENQGGHLRIKDDRTLVALLSESAEENGLLLAQLEQRQSSVTVRIENQSFSGAFNWLRYLVSEHDVIIDQAAMNYVDSDRMNARFTFRGGVKLLELSF